MKKWNVIANFLSDMNSLSNRALNKLAAPLRKSKIKKFRFKKVNIFFFFSSDLNQIEDCLQLLWQDQQGGNNSECEDELEFRIWRWKEKSDCVFRNEVQKELVSD